MDFVLRKASAQVQRATRRALSKGQREGYELYVLFALIAFSKVQQRNYLSIWKENKKLCIWNMYFMSVFAWRCVFIHVHLHKYTQKYIHIYARTHACPGMLCLLSLAQRATRGSPTKFHLQWVTGCKKSFHRNMTRFEPSVGWSRNLKLSLSSQHRGVSEALLTTHRWQLAKWQSPPDQGEKQNFLTGKKNCSLKISFPVFPRTVRAPFLVGFLRGHSH